MKKNATILLGTSLTIAGLLLGACGGDDESASGDGDGDGDGDTGTGGTPGDGDGDVGGAPGDGDGDVALLFDFSDDSDISAFEPGTQPPAGGGGAGGAGGESDDKTHTTIITWVDDDGDPDDGAMKFEIPFNGYSQATDYQHVFDAPQDFSGMTYTVRVKLVSGYSPDPSAPGGIILYAKSGSAYTWGQAPWANIGPDLMGSWNTYVFSLDLPDPGSSVDGFDASEVVAIGIKIHTGAGVDATELPSEAVFLIDTVQISE